jgi:hypothetical protein
MSDASTLVLDGGANSSGGDAALLTTVVDSGTRDAAGGRGDGGASKDAGRSDAGPEPSNIMGSPKDPFQFQAGIQIQIDGFASLGPSTQSYQRADGSGLDPGFAVQRLRPQFRGQILNHFSYLARLELGLTNSGGPNQTFQFRGGVLDAWAAYFTDERLIVQLGQMPLPFGIDSLPGAFSDYMMEPTRTMFLVTNGAPQDIGIRASGIVGPLVYSVGWYNGEGFRRGPTDGNGAMYSRLALRTSPEASVRAQIGFSGKVAGYDADSAFADSPTAPFTTVRGYQFWTPSYLINNAVVPTAVTVLPSGQEIALAGDVTLQAGPLAFMAQGMYYSSGRREALRNLLDSDQTLRQGELSGITYFGSLLWWLTPPTKQLARRYYQPLILLAPIARATPPEELDWSKPSVSLSARWEQFLLKYDSISRSPQTVERGLLDLYGTDLIANMLSFGASAWWTSRIRLMAEYGFHWFPADEVAPRRFSNQALAPGQVVQGERGTRPRSDIPAQLSFGDPTWYRPYNSSARTLHEISLRVQLAFP